MHEIWGDKSVRLLVVTSTGDIAAPRAGYVRSLRSDEPARASHSTAEGAAVAGAKLGPRPLL